MKTTLVLALLLAPMLQLPAAAQKLSFGQLCHLIITNPGAVPQDQVYVVPKASGSQTPLFSGDITTCVIYQMAAWDMHEQNWNYSKQVIQWYNQQALSHREAIAADVSKSSSRYPDLKALVKLDYLRFKDSTANGHYIALSSGP
ncbi:MAG TPA: hypothetical protein V6D03_15840 [Candidatus Caenarcaniphilales bacterium]